MRWVGGVESSWVSKEIDPLGGWGARGMKILNISETENSDSPVY